MTKFFWCFFSLFLLPLFFSKFSFANAKESDDWYTYRSIGTGFHSYTGQGKQYIERYKNRSDVKQLTINFDTLGLYKPLMNGQILIGGVLHGTLDRLDADNSIVYLAKFQAALSGFYFLTENVKGWFLRTDIGPVRHLTAHDPHFYPEYTWGAGLLLGGGYSLKLTKGSSLAFQLFANPGFNDGEIEQNMGVSLGLFLRPGIFSRIINSDIFKSDNENNAD